MFSSLLMSDSPVKEANPKMDQLGALFGSLSTSSAVTLPKLSALPPEKSKKQIAFEELDILGESLLKKCKDDILHSR